MSNSKFLAVDIGAESGRAFVGILHRGGISLEEIYRFPNSPVEISGHLHWDISGLFERIKESMKFAVERGHADIGSIAVDTWGVDYGLLRKDDCTIDLPFTYRDSRTDGVMEKVFGRITREEIYSRTGIQFMQINSIYQLYGMIDGGDCLDNYDKLLFMPDIFNYFLSGEKFSEYTIASTSQMLNAGSGKFDEKILSSLGIPKDLMCPVVMPGTVIGKLLPSLRAETGLKDVDVIAVGSHDTASAIAAVPASGQNWAYLSSGTWSLLGIESSKPIINEISREKNFTNEGGVCGRFTFLKNITGMWLLQEVRRNWERNKQIYAYDDIVAMARSAPGFKCIIDPGDESFLNPGDMSYAIQKFCRRTGQPAPSDKGEYVRCILESLALKYKAEVERLESITETVIERLHIVGGGSRNDLLNQFTANATGISVTAGPVEATTLGNIMVQAIAKAKLGSLEEGRKLVAESFPLKEYRPEDTAAWNEKYHGITFNL